MPLAERGKCLKTLKTARASYWLKLAWIWDGRRHALGLGKYCSSPVDEANSPRAGHTAGGAHGAAR